MDDAEAGLNLPPIHPNCKCTIRAKAKIDLFKNREGANPLKENPKFEEWKKRHVKEKAKEPLQPLTEPEQHAMNNYISSASYVWNDKLRRGERLTKEEQQSIEKAKEPLQPLTEPEQHAMNNYISSASYVWNDKLRRGERLTKEEQQSIENLDSALKKMPKYKGTLYRSLSEFGIPDVEEFIKGHIPGRPIQFREYLSTSEEVYDESFPIQYVIQSKSGRDIQKFNPGEKEILFERNTWFIPTKIEGNIIYMEEM